MPNLEMSVDPSCAPLHHVSIHFFSAWKNNIGVKLQRGFCLKAVSIRHFQSLKRKRTFLEAINNVHFSLFKV